MSENIEKVNKKSKCKINGLLCEAEKEMTGREFDVLFANTTIDFARTRENAVLPTKRQEDGCYDIYAALDNDLTIHSHKVALVPTGLKSAFPSSYRIGIRERGSNTKSCLITMAGQIDSGYRGEWFVALYNGNDKDVVLTVAEGDKVVDTPVCIKVPVSKAIAQFAIERIPSAFIREVSVEDIENNVSERGNGSLGSSGK